jgi:hypothetical protein
MLAKDRVVISFAGDNAKKTSIKDNRKGDSIIVSSTGQLQWNYKKKGYFTINTNGTQGVTGFAKDEEIRLKDISLRTSNEFAVILVSSIEKGKAISSAKSILVTTVARARNSQMEYNEDRTQLLKVGEAPILLEPVIVQLQLNKRKVEVYVLDHTGRRTGEKIPVQNGGVLLDGSKYKAIYYEIVAE